MLDGRNFSLVLNTAVDPTLGVRIGIVRVGSDDPADNLVSIGVADGKIEGQESFLMDGSLDRTNDTYYLDFRPLEETNPGFKLRRLMLRPEPSIYEYLKYYAAGVAMSALSRTTYFTDDIVVRLRRSALKPETLLRHVGLEPDIGAYIVLARGRRPDQLRI